MPLKNYLPLLLLILNLPVFAQNKQQTVTSTIEKVTLFTSGGQVHRTAKASVPAGKTVLVFAGISPDIEKQSIQVKGIGRFTILSVVHQLNFINEQDRREEITRIQSQQATIQRKLTQEKNILQVYKNEEAILLKNQSIGGSATGVKTLDLKEAVDFHRTRLIDLFQKQAEVNQNISSLDSLLLKNRQQLSALNQPKNYATSEVLVTVQAAAATTAQFEMGYFVKKAGWFATYDLKVQDISNPIELTLKANVFQQSGEDWKEIKLTISNGNPTQNSVAPALQPWYLRYGYNPPPGSQVLSRNEAVGRVVDANTGESLPGVMIKVKGTQIGTVTDMNGNFSLKLPANVRIIEVASVGYTSKEVTVGNTSLNIAMEQAVHQLQEVVVTAGYGTADRDGFDESPSLNGRLKKAAAPTSIPLASKETYQATTISYEIEMPYTILNDGKVNMVEVKAMTVPASYEYFAAPKIIKEVFLTAKIADWQELNLLEGEINLFFEGAFLGKSVLDFAAAGDTLDVSLGTDKSITVERKKLKEFTSKQFFSNNKTDNRAYEIIVRNNKQLPITILVQDQLPISTSKEITVDEQETSGAEVNPDTKLVSWKYQLEARQEKKHIIRYSVKYPKNQVLMLD